MSTEIRKTIEQKEYIMHIKQPWIRLTGDMRTAWRQWMQEGRRVEAFRELCEQADACQEFPEEAARALDDSMALQPLRDDFYFDEPSNFEEIRKNWKGSSTQASAPNPDKIKGAWTGRVAGCLLGKPVEGWLRTEILEILKQTRNYPMHRYFLKTEVRREDLPFSKCYDTFCFADAEEIMQGDDDTNYTVLALRLFELYGSDFTSDEVLNNWLQRLPYLCACTAERVAYRNATAGMTVPQTALFHNPYREWIGAQIRADFYGYLCPGEPARAAEFAFRDASVSHVKNGIYGAMGVAAMIAAAAVETDARRIAEQGLNYMPQNSRLYRECRTLLNNFAHGESFDDLLAGICERYGQSEWVHTIPNYLIVLLALLFGENDFGKSVCLAVSAGYDTDCNGATVGSIMGMLKGFSGLDSGWYSVFRETTRTGICDTPIISADEFTRRTLDVLSRISENTSANNEHRTNKI